ncbi:MAG: helix-turn-helix domain-containing protein, partial [Burkholderiales bacterium]|nr:helix-turn-helix domain-containing protein [Burkholderiales bacterium]
EGIAIAKKEGKYRGRGKILSEEQQTEMLKMVADRYKKVDIAKRYGITRMALYNYINNHKKII